MMKQIMMKTFKNKAKLSVWAALVLNVEDVCTMSGVNIWRRTMSKTSPKGRPNCPISNAIFFLTFCK